MINRDPDYLTLELLPRKWGKALRERGLDVTYSKGCMRVDASQGRVAELQVRRDGLSWERERRGSPPQATNRPAWR